MHGKLVLISGLSGSGKTTLIGGALQALPQLSYLQTYTTRPMRAGEVGGHEYVFVGTVEYDRRRQASSDWDHTEYAGYQYGADAGAIKATLAAGEPVICSVAPDISVIRDMAKLYAVAPTTVWIDVPKALTDLRTQDDAIRYSRNEDIAMSANFDHIFAPVGSLEADIAAFVKLLQSLIA